MAKVGPEEASLISISTNGSGEWRVESGPACYPYRSSVAGWAVQCGDIKSRSGETEKQGGENRRIGEVG